MPSPHQQPSIATVPVAATGEASFAPEPVAGPPAGLASRPEAAERFAQIGKLAPAALESDLLHAVSQKTPEEVQAAPAELCVWAAGGLKPPTKRKLELDMDSCQVDLQDALVTPAKVPCDVCSAPLPDARPRFWDTVDLGDILEADAGGLFPDAMGIAALGYDDATWPQSATHLSVEDFHRTSTVYFLISPKIGKPYFMLVTDKL